MVEAAVAHLLNADGLLLVMHALGPLCCLEICGTL
jgi:hypothetical protein